MKILDIYISKTIIIYIYIYSSEKHEQMIFPVKYYGNTLLYDELSQSKCVLECVAYPIDEGIERPQSHPGLAAGR